MESVHSSSNQKWILVNLWVLLLRTNEGKKMNEKFVLVICSETFAWLKIAISRTFCLVWSWNIQSRNLIWETPRQVNWYILASFSTLGTWRTLFFWLPTKSDRCFWPLVIKRKCHCRNSGNGTHLETHLILELHILFLFSLSFILVAKKISVLNNCIC